VPKWIPQLNYEIIMGLERITFSDGEVRVDVEPRLWVSNDGRIVGVGDRPSDGSGRPIPLFEQSSADETPRFDALVKFFRYVISVMQRTRLFTMRPYVRVHGATSLRPLLNGYEEEIVRQALLQSGAAKVVFSP
jgi:hypothetical protein